MKKSTIFLLSHNVNNTNKSIINYSSWLKRHKRLYVKMLLIAFFFFFYFGFKAKFPSYNLHNKIVAVILTLIPAIIIIKMTWTDIKRHHHKLMPKRLRKKSKLSSINYDKLDGHTFELFCADLLKQNGFKNVIVTKRTGDQGIDIIADKKGKKYGFQCKCYSKPVGNKAVQEAYAGAKYYDCRYAAVITNQGFTKSAIELSKKLGVILYDRNVIEVLRNTLK